MTEPVHRALGLTDDELDRIIEIQGREPNELELAMYSVMWSEHCSYKSSRAHLSRLPTEAPHVLVGPGENAGVIDVGDGIALALRIESHNHPSAVEPYQGAATGVGGILRDIFTMGARPIAVLDPLRFGPLDDPRSRWIAEGVVSGISGYGNSVGVPTVGGEVVFDETYADNPLVNVMCLGILPTERLVLGQASGVGNLAVLLGSPTGRDGIGGVSVLASAGFGDGDEEKRPSVQVGDPYEEKRLIEACLALLDAGLVVGIQDLGGAGLTCATSETAGRAGTGMDVDVNVVPRRETAMTPVEVMTSESQERMLAIVEPSDLDAVLGLCERWEVQATVIGKVNDSGRLRIREGFDGDVIGDLPAAALSDEAPLYHRPMEPPADLADRQADVERLAQAPDDVIADLVAMTVDTSWVWRQYDHQLFLNTVAGPGADAAVLRLRHPSTGEPTGRGIAITTDGNHRWCAIDPRAGTAAVVGEALLNLACVGAEAKALVNCLNFGNPEHPEVMWQLSEAIDGMAEMCRVSDLPVVGGNVSLYNESRGRNIDPTPIVGVVGVIDDLRRQPPGSAPGDGDAIVVLGDEPSGPADLSGSRWAFDRAGHRRGRLPQMDLEATIRLATLVRDLVRRQEVSAAHDVAAGGLAVTLGEMAVASGRGISLDHAPDHVALFAELPLRAVVGVHPAGVGAVVAAAYAAGVACRVVGVSGGTDLDLGADRRIAVADLATSASEALPAAFAAGARH